MNASFRNRQIPEVIRVLSDLNKFRSRPAKVQKTNIEILMDKLAKWTLILAVAIMGGIEFLALWQMHANNLTDAVKISAQWLILLSVGLALLALVFNIVSQSVILFRWRAMSFDGFREDIMHEQSMAFQLSKYSSDVLTDARYWLELKIKRVESRVSYFFGEKTAILAILATAYPISKELGGTSGGIKWMETTIYTGMTWGNFPNMLLLWLCAFVLGLSLGAVLLRKVAARYRYQVELIDLARR